MAAQKGIELLLKIGAVDSSPVTIGGLRATSFTVNNEMVDVTNKDSAGARTLLEGGGVTSLTISADGTFDDSSSHDTLRASALGDTIDTYSLFLPNGDTIEADFQITSYERAGAYNDAETFTITLESSGAITYTAAS